MEAWGPNLQISLIFVIFGKFSARKGQSLLEVQIDQEPTFGSVVFQCFFECPLFSIFFDLGCPEAPFRLLFGGPGPLKKQLKVCNYRQIQRFGPFETEPFCRPRSGRRFDEEFFEICAILRFPFGHIFAPVVVKKQV